MVTVASRILRQKTQPLGHEAKCSGSRFLNYLERKSNRAPSVITWGRHTLPAYALPQKRVTGCIRTPGTVGDLKVWSPCFQTSVTVRANVMSIKCSEDATDGPQHLWPWCRETGDSRPSSWAHKKTTFPSLLRSYLVQPFGFWP